MLSMMTSKKDGRLKNPGDARFRDLRRAEQKYKDVIKTQRQEIAKLTDEIERIRQLVKKFLNPEQLAAFRTSAEEASSKRDCGELTVEVAEGEGGVMTDDEGSPMH
jgi:predicted  nucleic acid-binding Zn-ribbon protein